VYDIVVALLLTLAPLQGLATYYGPPAFVQGDVMANGRPLDLWGPTVAVDDGLKHLLNERVLVVTECRTMFIVTITDTGHFDEECLLFRKGQRRVGNWIQERYWCVLEAESKGMPVVSDTLAMEDVGWLEDGSWPVVADFPQWYFARIACKVDAYGHGDTMRVGIWPLEEVLGEAKGD